MRKNVCILLLIVNKYDIIVVKDVMTVLHCSMPCKNKGKVRLMGAINNNYKRIFSVDISCILGTILLVGLHFFQKSGYEQTELSGILSIFPLALRWLCMAGAPLVILINGAAFYRDTFSFSQYKGIIKLVYFTAICFFMVYFYSGGHPDSFPESSIKPFYYFDGCDFALIYALVLLLAPFLNCLYQGLPNLKCKTILVCILVFLSSMPNILIFGDKYILPTELTQLWPITFYFLGAYIWENRKKFDFLSYFVLLLTICISQAILSYSDSMNEQMHYFDSKRLNQYSSINVVATAAVIFMMMCNVKAKKKYKRIFAETLARLSLPVIMISWIIEENILRLLIGSKEYGEMALMKFFLPFVIVTIIGAYIGAMVISIPYNFVSSFFNHKSMPETAEELSEEYFPELSADDTSTDEDAADFEPDEKIEDGAALAENAEEYHYVGRYEASPKKENVATSTHDYKAELRKPDDISVDELIEMILNK